MGASLVQSGSGKKKDTDMKKAISALALATALAAGAAQAADIPSRKGPPAYMPPPPMFSWTGFYVGLNLGGGWQERNNNNWGWGGGSSSNGGIVGGAQIGYNYQLSPMFVVGVETDFQGTSIGSGGGNNNNNWWLFGGGFPGFGWGGGGAARIDWFGTVRGRLGLTLPNWPQLMIYGTGGFAYGDVRGAGLWAPWSQTQTGWTAGGGVEWAFMPNWSAKAEYLYTELSGNNNNNWGWGWGGNANNRTRFHTIRAGLNYHFNFGGAAPVLASY
jgi:outer membrane immunogenic protein